MLVETMIKYLHTYKVILLVTGTALSIVFSIYCGTSVMPGYVILAICKLIIYSLFIFINFALEFHLQISFIHWGCTVVWVVILAMMPTPSYDS